MSKLVPFVGGGLFDELFRDITPGYYIKPLHGDALPTQIKLDIKESAEEYTVHAEIPGATKDNIHVNVENNVVSISANISQVDSQNKDDKLLRTERYYGEVSRSFQLPSDIQSNDCKAKYENGILTLNLPKSQKKTGQRLTID